MNTFVSPGGWSVSVLAPPALPSKRGTTAHAVRWWEHHDNFLQLFSATEVCTNVCHRTFSPPVALRRAFTTRRLTTRLDTGKLLGDLGKPSPTFRRNPVPCCPLA